MNELGSSAWSSGRRLAVITGAWCFFAALLTINNYVYPAMMGQPVTWRDAARFPVITYAIWTLFTPLVLFVCERIHRRRWTPPLWVAAHAAFAIFTLLLIAALWLPFAEIGTDAGQPARYSWHTISGLFWQSLAWNLWMYCVIVGIFYGLDYYFSARDARVRAAQLEAQLASAELEILKNQLQPHFLFNTLNLISSLIHTDQASADDMVGDLGALLRMSLESHASHEVSLEEEMKAIELYLNIQRLRFQDTLSIQIQIAPETLKARVPHLILQPIVENAFRHGISKRVGQGLLSIESTMHNGTMKIFVSDNGPGANGSSANLGIGLNNTRSRLEKLYGSRASLDLSSSSLGFIVTLGFPLTVQTNDSGD